MSQSHLDALENESLYVIREARAKFPKLGMLWSIGKDSTVLLWLARKAFFGECPIPIVHIDTSYKIPEMIRYRDEIARRWGLQLIVSRNEAALKAGMSYKAGRIECCTALKTQALRETVAENGFQGILLGIRRDEEGTRAKERVFSPRGENFEWNFRDQPPEFWSQFQTDFPAATHVRVHPLLHWTELNVWEYIEREKIEVIDLYFAKNGKRYRSLGCAPCTAPIDSTATTVSEIVQELRASTTSERDGRAQDRADAYAMQKLRVTGYM